MTNGIWIWILLFLICHNYLGEHINSFGSFISIQNLSSISPTPQTLYVSVSHLSQTQKTTVMPHKADRAADVQRENFKKKRREMEQPSLDATSDLLDTDSNATFAMVMFDIMFIYIKRI